MTFAEKLKECRKNKNLTQKQLAQEIGVTLRTVASYELDNRYPRSRELYGKLANALGVNINYLLTENEEFTIEARELYGNRGEKQAKDLLESATGLFAGGEIAEEDKDVLMRAIQDAYWIAKEKNRKYIPKKYRSE